MKALTLWVMFPSNFMTAWSSLKMSVVHSVSQAVNAVLEDYFGSEQRANCKRPTLTQLVEDLRGEVANLKNRYQNFKTFTTNSTNQLTGLMSQSELLNQKLSRLGVVLPPSSNTNRWKGVY